MANALYNRGASFNPDELADGDAIEAEFDSVGRGFDAIEGLVNVNKAGYPTQTFHVATATADTHAVPKAQMDTALGFKLDAVNYNATDVLNKLKTVDGSGSGVDADLLDGQHGSYYSDASNINAGTLAKERLPASIDADTVGNAATATKITATAAAGATADLVKGAMGTNDGFRIRVGGGVDAGWIEIATSDNGDEPIYIRQYTGDFYSIARTLTLLDASGNTTLPGSAMCNLVRVSDNGKEARLGVGQSDVYVYNQTANTYLQLKDDGSFKFSSNEVYHYGNRDSMVAQQAVVSAGGVGSYIMAQPSILSAGDYVLGYTRAGSGLRPAVASYDSNAQTGTLSGTWRCMGRLTTNSSAYPSTLWLRIA